MTAPRLTGLRSRMNMLVKMSTFDEVVDDGDPGRGGLRAMTRNMGVWSLWILDCLLRLLAVNMASWFLVALVTLFSRGGGGWNPINWAIGSYLGLLVGALVYLPLLLLGTGLTSRWRLTALLLSPVIAAGGLLVVLLWMPDPLVPTLWAITTAAIFGVVVPAPGRPSFLSVAGALAVLLVVALLMFGASTIR